LTPAQGHYRPMKSAPQFSFKDVLRAPARALSAKQILVMTVFLIAGLAVYDIFTYLAFAFQGESVRSAFSAYGLFPFVQTAFGNSWVQGLYWLGVAMAVLVVMLGFCGVSIINIEAVRGNRFCSARQAIRFALQRFRQIFLAELSIVVFVAFVVLLFFLLGLVSRIPYLGEWLYVLLFTLPNFIISLFIIFIIFVFTLTVLVLPAVAAAERNGETFTAILETFSTIILKPFQWAGYTAYSLAAAKVCSFIYAYFAYRAVEFLIWSSSLGGGESLERLAKASLAHLPVKSDFVAEIFNIFPGVPFGVDVAAMAGFPSKDALSYVMAFMILLIFASILGYLLAIVAAAQARGYVALRFMKDDYNIAEEPPLFFEDEPVNEPLTEDELAEFDNGKEA